MIRNSDARRYSQVITKLLYLLNQGERFTNIEATEVFFAVTKLFQSKDTGLRRMVYLIIKELSPSCDEIGPLNKGLNPISIGNLVFTSPYLQHAVKAISEGIAVGRTLALMKNHHIDGNKEMIAFGLMNIAGSFTSCYLTTGATLL